MGLTRAIRALPYPVLYFGAMAIRVLLFFVLFFVSFVVANAYAQQPKNADVAPTRLGDQTLPQPLPKFLRNLGLTARLEMGPLTTAEVQPRHRGPLTSVGV
jgi:hypothetical protein